MQKSFLISIILHLILLFIGIFLENKSQKQLIKINIQENRHISKIELVVLEKRKNNNKEMDIKNNINNEKNKSIISNTLFPNKSSIPTKLKKSPLIKKNGKNAESIEEFSSSKKIPQEIYKKSINFKILKEVQPKYPKKAKLIKFNKKIVIETKFLVDSSGKVKDIIFLSSYEKLGFNDEVIKALKKWEFEPIILNNKETEVYFYKKFIFNPN